MTQPILWPLDYDFFRWHHLGGNTLCVYCDTDAVFRLAIDKTILVCENCLIDPNWMIR